MRISGADCKGSMVKIVKSQHMRQTSTFQKSKYLASSIPISDHLYRSAKEGNVPMTVDRKFLT